MGERSNSIGTEFSADLSTGSTNATFFNGKQLEIQYMNKFTSIQKIIRLINLHVHLDMCLDGQQGSCRCHLLSDFGGTYV